ncbi:hypothetical protein LCGC14_0475890 [marine sediment metagenome]|uniref:Calcineurin-like phosphoesterase domain-containing protein n=1 Tax=marine sediment metagenome TaxID=412755 RepID=A0A0F9STM2_9ZZZZ
MYIHEEIIQCKGRSDRVEIFPFYDMHVGKRNCDEKAIKKQIAEIIRRKKIPGRHVRVLLGGDQLNAINPKDIRRFDFNELAAWFFEPKKTVTVAEILSNISTQEVKHAAELLEPIQPYIIGALEGNHEKSMKTQQNVNVHSALCTMLDVRNLTDEAMIRFKFTRESGASSTIKLYMRHGYGSGRSDGAEPNKLGAILKEWDDMDVCLTGHTHSFCIAAPKPVLYLPNRGKLPERPYVRHRYAGNPGCWLLSHDPGESTYESMAAYPARPMMTLKIVIWPFWGTHKNGTNLEQPKIEMRSYPII